MSKILPVICAVAALAMSTGADAALNQFDAVSMSRTTGCGTTADKHFCKSMTLVDTNTAVLITSKSFSGSTSSGSETLATWTGSVSCRVQGEALDVDHFEAEVDIVFQLQSESAPIEVNGPGGASVGFLQTQPVGFIHRDTQSITLTRLFESQISQLQVRAKPTFKNGTNGTCTVSGGQFNWTTVVRVKGRE